MKSKFEHIKVRLDSLDLNSHVGDNFNLQLINQDFLKDFASLQKILTVREKNSDFYFNRIIPNLENLKEYLHNGPILDPNHYLFTLFDHNHNLILICGFKTYQGKLFEIDNVMRVSPEYPGLMYSSLYSLIKTIYKYFEVKSIFLKVTSNNELAIKLYKSLNFSIVDKIYLKSVDVSKTEFKLVPCSSHESNTAIMMYKMELTKSI
jgi:ribosomal protein S18 acetylase RimI-like enzyme